MNKGYLLDTGPLVAILDKSDRNHEKAKKLFSKTQGGLITCEAVIAEACFLAGRIHREAPLEIINLGVRGLYRIGFEFSSSIVRLKQLFSKYHNVPISFADASLIICAEIYNQAQILTFDSDFEIYRWNKNKKFEIIS